MSSLDPEQAAYLRTRFLERVAHELRSPLAVIDGAMQELEHALGEEIAERNRALFQMMKRGIRRVARTADRLQQTAMCESAELMLASERRDLAELLRWSVAEAVTNEGRRNVKVELDVADRPCFGEVDGRWMAVALYELASNAIRHARERVTIGLSQVGDTVEIRFVDDSRIQREFEPLRFKPPTEARGLGLALAIVRDVVTAHRGDLRIEHMAPAGSTGGEARQTHVSIRIPAAQRSVRALGAAQ